MEYLTSIGDLDKSKVKILLVDDVYDLIIYVTTDNKVLFWGHTSNAHGVVDYAYCLYKINGYLKDNRGSREWLSIHSDLPKEEVDNYTITVEQLKNKELDLRNKKANESKKAVLRKLMAEFPEVVKEFLEEQVN